MSQPLSPLAARLAAHVAAARNKRILVAEMFTVAQGHDLSLVGDPAARGRFRRALDELAVVSLVILPSVASRSGWDAIVEPPLPVWVTRVDRGAAGPAAKPAPRVWPSALEAAGRIASRPDELAVLECVADWRRDNPAPVRVPVGERSAELFGDEKALGRYRKTRLFTSGALTLDLLACYDPPLPFASQHVPGVGSVILLVAENLATYTSFLTAARALGAATRPDLHVAWGIGGSSRAPGRVSAGVTVASASARLARECAARDGHFIAAYAAACWYQVTVAGSGAVPCGRLAGQRVEVQTHPSGADQLGPVAVGEPPGDERF